MGPKHNVHYYLKIGNACLYLYKYSNDILFPSLSIHPSPPLPTHTVTQVCVAAASISSIPDTPTRIQFWMRLTSTSKHRPPTDSILATVKPGDFIHIASPCRGARRVDDFEAIIRYCDQSGLVLTTAAVGMYVGAPVYVRSAGGLEYKLSTAQAELFKDFRAAFLGFMGIAEVWAGRTADGVRQRVPNDDEVCARQQGRCRGHSLG